MLRRRVMEESKQGSQYPFYSDYPTITEYGTFCFQPQTEDKAITNLFLKLDDTPYNYCGGATKSTILYVEYTAENIAIRKNLPTNPVWIHKEQESSRFSLKRCAGTETYPPLVTFKIDKIS